MRARRRALADHDVELVVLKRRVKDFFERRLQAVNFVDEEDLPVAKIGQDGGQFALDLQMSDPKFAEKDSQLVGDDVGKSRLAQAGRPIKQERGPAPRRASAQPRSRPRGSL